MNFISTRGGAPAASLSQAFASGLAPDGGLYVPAELPRAVLADAPVNGSLADVGRWLLAPFFAGDRLEAELPAICAEAFAFEAPLRPLADGQAQLLELFHGPTAAFKDFGAAFLAACLRRLRAADDPPLTILVATSGDTGAAVAAAFHGLPGIRVQVLYPDGRVSPRQAHQLGCFGDNAQAWRVAGNFDDCQKMVKQALGDPALQARVPISSANSISLGRLLPQMVYYARAALAWRQQHDGPALGFVIPTGNLGNALACLWARAMGVPIGAVHLACNANDVLPDYFADGDYRPRAGIRTLANAMDVGAPSNFERLRQLYPDDDTLRRAVSAGSVDDPGIRATIKDFAARGDILCPHTATAASEWQRLAAEGEHGPWALVATAHPAKFDSIVEPLVGHALAIPASLAALLRRPSQASPMAPRPAALREALVQWQQRRKPRGAASNWSATGN